MYHYKATITKWVDGDTLDVRIELGFHMTANIRIRLGMDVDTLELRGAEKVGGKKVKAWCEMNWPVGTEIEVATKKTGKYGRWLGILVLDKLNLNDIIAQYDKKVRKEMEH